MRSKHYDRREDDITATVDFENTDKNTDKSPKKTLFTRIAQATLTVWVCGMIIVIVSMLIIPDSQESSLGNQYAGVQEFVRERYPDAKITDIVRTNGRIHVKLESDRQIHDYYRANGLIENYIASTDWSDSNSEIVIATDNNDGIAEGKNNGTMPAPY